MTAPAVLVAGAGPAGVAAAVSLVAAGLPPERVLIIDRAGFPRSKPCGGGLTGHALDELRALGLELRVPYEVAPVGHLVYATARARVPLLRPVLVIRREEFDADLLAQARARGIVVRERVGLASWRETPAAPRDQRLTVDLTDGSRLRVGVLVGADGAASVVRRHLLARQGGESPTQPLRLCRAEIPRPRGWQWGGTSAGMIYDFTAMAWGLRGYIWVFPAPGDRLNVGAMHHPIGGAGMGPARMGTLLEGALGRFGLTLDRRPAGWPAWPYQPQMPLAGSGALLVGDAAGIDALTGEGIAVGLAHGRLAAAPVLAALQGDDGPLHAWTATLRAAPVGRELALDDVVARLLYGSHPPERVLGLVMEDEAVQRLYAARVAGGANLADEKAALLGALARHVWLSGGRGRRLARARRGVVAPPERSVARSPSTSA